MKRRQRHTVPTEEQYRNTLTIRWTDREHRLVSDTAWRNRLSCSEMIRNIVLGELETEQEQGQGQGGASGQPRLVDSGRRSI